MALNGPESFVKKPQLGFNHASTYTGHRSLIPNRGNPFGRQVSHHDRFIVSSLDSLSQYQSPSRAGESVYRHGPSMHGDVLSARKLYGYLVNRQTIRLT